MYNDVLTKLEPMRIAVFGGNGFIGSHFVEQLVEWGHTVTVFDRYSSGVENYNASISGRINKVRGRLEDVNLVGSVLKDVTIVYNFISAYNPRSSWNHATESVQTDVINALNLFELCVKHNISKVVYISSGGTVYGPQSGTVTETCLPKPFNPHGISKLAVEHFLEYYKVKYGISADVYRVGNVYGPRQPLVSTQGVIAVWMHQILNGKPIDVYGDENTYRDYIFVRDAAYLLGHSLAAKATSDTYNVGTGVGVSIIELLNIFKEIIDIPFVSNIHPRRLSDNTSSVLSSAKLCSHYPNFCFRDLKSMLQYTWNYVKKEHRNER